MTTTSHPVVGTESAKVSSLRLCSDDTFFLFIFQNQVEDQGNDSPSDSDDEVKTPSDKNISRGEKKSRKAMAKLGLRHIPGVYRVTIQKARNVVFGIHTPDVYKSPNSDTYVVFGEAKIDDFAGQMASNAAEQYRTPNVPKMGADFSGAAGAGASDLSKITEVSEEDGDADESDLKASDIELVMSQGGASRQKAIAALRRNNKDVVNAIMDLTA